MWSMRLFVSEQPQTSSKTNLVLLGEMCQFIGAHVLNYKLFPNF